MQAQPHLSWITGLGNEAWGFHMQSLDLHHLRLLINLIGAVAALIASGCWFRSTTIKVPDDKEIAIDHLRRAGVERLRDSLFWHSRRSLFFWTLSFHLLDPLPSRTFLFDRICDPCGCACYSNRADMEASHGREIFPRKIWGVSETSRRTFVE
jgi:hypothetical protein